MVVLRLYYKSRLKIAESLIGTEKTKKNKNKSLITPISVGMTTILAIVLFGRRFNKKVIEKWDVFSYIVPTISVTMNRIKEVLKEKGIKQIWLADKLGKSYNMVNGYVQNRKQPSIECLYEIAGILNISPKELLVENE